MKNKLLIVALLCVTTAQAQLRQEILLQDNWQFSHDQITWQTVSVPHDWAISGPFDKRMEKSKPRRRVAEVVRCLGLGKAIINKSSRFHRDSAVTQSWSLMAL